jgi:hypothetical protein
MSVELKIKFHRLLNALGRYIRKYKISNHGMMIERYLLRRTIKTSQSIALRCINLMRILVP